MGYLVYNDYALTIQDFAFKQWIASNDLLRLQAEPRAQAKIKEYLVQKYDLATEFADTTVYKDSAIYKANALIQLNYAAWSTAAPYVVGDLVSFTDGNAYRCIQNASSIHSPIDPAYWLLLGAQLGLQHLQYPYAVFDLSGFYKTGDIVFWKNKIYKNLIPTVIPDHLTDLQSITISNIPNYNIFPDDPINGVNSWGVGVPYSISGKYPNFVATQGIWSSITSYAIGDTVTDANGILWQSLTVNLNKQPGDDITNWQSITWAIGDNRNQSILDVYVAIVLYYLSFRIAPKVIPQWVQGKYDAAMIWLQNSAEGLITLDVPEIQPAQGQRIRYGGQVKQNNSWN